ncbi:MAG: phage major capsid protein [Salinisphaera sp.]|nr:phage major capsid protein [Salinisphaera sp.]
MATLGKSDDAHSRDRDQAAQARPRSGVAPAHHGIPAGQTRAWSAEQIAKRQPEGLARSAEIRQIDEEARTVELSFSSEEAVRRFFGDEVLSHAPGAMRMDRLNASAPLLMNHEWEDQIGVIESAEIKNRKGRAVVRFSRAAKAEEVFQDVIDGIRKNVSVGYSIHGVNVQERDGQPDLVTVTDWEPMEISFAAVAADISVGVGRAKSLENPPEDAPAAHGENDTRHKTHARTDTNEEPPAMKIKTLRDAEGNLVRAKVDENDKIVEVLETLERAGESEAHAKRSGQESGERAGREAEQTRTKTLLEMGEQYGAADLARTAVSEGTDVDAFRGQLLEHMNSDRSNSGNRARSLGDQGAEIGMSERDKKQYSFMRAVRAMANPTNQRAQAEAAFEFECSEEAQKKMDRGVEGMIVPFDVLNRALNTSTAATAAGDTGGNLIQTDLLTSSFIDLLRNRTIAMQMARTMAGLVGFVDIPKQTSGGQAYWVGEGEDVAETALDLGQIHLAPHTVGAYQDVTRRQIMQTSMDMEALLRADLAKAMALEIDRAFFYGTGSGQQPLGLANVAGINAVALGTPYAAGPPVVQAQPTYEEIVEMESQIAADNADVAGMTYVMNSQLKGTLKTTEKFPNAMGRTVWEDGDTVNGYNTAVSNEIARGDIIFGNYMDAIIGMWGGLELFTNPYKHSLSGTLEISVKQDIDFAIRRPESFCIAR